MSVQIIEEGPRNCIVKIDNVGGGSGIAFDASAQLLPPFTRVNINRIWSSVPAAGTVILSWDADTDVEAFAVNEAIGDLDFTFFGGIRNNAGAGVTGDLLYAGPETGNWTVILHLIKH